MVSTNGVALQEKTLSLLARIAEGQERMNALLAKMAGDMAVLRQFLAGPFIFTTYNESTERLAVPITLTPGASTVLVNKKPGPGSMFLTIVTVSSEDVVVTFEVDGSILEVPLHLVEMAELSPYAPPAFLTQADRANNLFTFAIWPGDSLGYAFFRYASLSVRNASPTETVLVYKFLVRVKQFRPLEEFGQILAR